MTGRWFSPGTPISPNNKTAWNIVESEIKRHKPTKTTNQTEIYLSNTYLLLLYSLYIVPLQGESIVWIQDIR
jgi:hypothetical protein